MSFTVGSCIANIPAKFGNRLNLANPSDQAPSVVAVTQAIQELTETYEFEELKYQTPVPPLTTLAMATAQPIIPIASLLATIAANSAAYPQFQNQNILDITDVYDFWMWFSSGVNQAGRLLDYRRVPTVDQDSYGITSNQQGSIGVAPPTYYTRFGSVLQVGPSPDNPYQFYVRMKLRHPFPIVPPFVPAVLSPVITAGAISSVLVTNNGTGYQPNQTNIPIIFSTPVSGQIATGNGATNGTGQLATVNVNSGGSGYTTANATASTAIVSGQQVFAPDAWQEIIEYAACLRLATWEGASEYITMFDNILKSKGVDVAEARAAKSQMKRDERHNSRGLSLRLGSPYTYAR